MNIPVAPTPDRTCAYRERCDCQAGTCAIDTALTALRNLNGVSAGEAVAEVIEQLWPVGR